jgi:cardiolipin synthase
LYAFPLLILSQVNLIGEAAFVIGWAFTMWGVALYFYTGFQYLFGAIRSLR